MRKVCHSIELINKKMALIQPIINDIAATWAKIISQRELFDSLKNSTQSEVEIEAVKDELNSLITLINSYIKEIEDLGGYVVDFKNGVIHMSMLYHDAEVLACIHLNDNRVYGYHYVDEPCKDRKQINAV